MVVLVVVEGCFGGGSLSRWDFGFVWFVFLALVMGIFVLEVAMGYDDDIGRI